MNLLRIIIMIKPVSRFFTYFYKCFIIVALICCNISFIKAQDSHFSQFYQAPAGVNPSLMAMQHEWSLRFIHRNQWSGIISPYRTSRFTANYPLINRDNQMWGNAGISLLNDRSGYQGMLHTNQAGAFFSYNVALSDNQYMSASLGVDYVSQRIQTDVLTSGNQWMNGSYNANADLGENFEKISVGYPAINSGLLWFKKDKDDDVAAYAGIAAFNMNRPAQKFIGNEDRLQMRWTATGAWRILKTGSWQLIPKILLMQQAEARNINAGANVQYALNNQSAPDYMKNIALNMGAYHRLNDAVIVSAGIDHQNYAAGVSYDMNVSSLGDQLDNNTTAVEFFAVFKMPVKRERNRRSIRRSSTSGTRKRRQKKAGNAPAQTKITVKDAQSGKPVEAEITTEDEEGNRHIHKTSGIDTTLKHGQRLQITLQKEAYQQKDTVIYIPEKTKDPVSIDIFMQSATDHERNNTKEDTLPAKDVKTPEPTVVDKQQIRFAPYESKLDQEADKNLDKIAKHLKQNPGHAVEITGHTDNTGSDSLNQKLSLNRARAVAEYLIKKGVSKDQLIIKGYSEDRAVAPNDTPQGRARNRRVEINVIERSK